MSADFATDGPAACRALPRQAGDNESFHLRRSIRSACASARADCGSRPLPVRPFAGRASDQLATIACGRREQFPDRRFASWIRDPPARCS